MGRLLVGFDGSPPSRRALDHAAREARAGGHDVVLVTILPPQLRGSSLAAMMPAGLELPPILQGTFEDTARLRLDEIASQLQSIGVKVRAQVRAGNAAEEVLQAADEHGATEIVIGHKAFEGGAVKLGPNAQRIKDLAKVRVTLVP